LSKSLTIRVSDDLHKKINHRLVDEDVSLQGIGEALLSEWADGGKSYVKAKAALQLLMDADGSDAEDHRQTVTRILKLYQSGGSGSEAKATSGSHSGNTHGGRGKPAGLKRAG
jgi:hypothetical protein